MKKAFSKVYLSIVYLFLYLPILILFFHSMSQKANRILLDFRFAGMRFYLKTSL